MFYRWEHFTTVQFFPVITSYMQAINKKDGVFGSADEDVLQMLATQAGIALQNANLFRNSEMSRDKFRSLLDIIRAMQGDMVNIQI